MEGLLAMARRVGWWEARWLSWPCAGATVLEIGGAQLLVQGDVADGDRRGLESTNLDKGSRRLGLPAAVGSARLRPVADDGVGR